MLTKKYYDGFIVHDILDKHLEPGKMMEVLTAFSKAKGVDAVEVIRCKDCRHYRRNDRRTFIRGSDCSKEIIDTIVPDKDFCSRAERKEE